MIRILNQLPLMICLSFSLNGNTDPVGNDPLQEEILKERELNKEKAKFAQELLQDAKSSIKQKKYDHAEKILLNITKFLEPNSYTWPIILDAALEKNAISLSKAVDAWKERNFDLCLIYIDEFRTVFYKDRNIQGDPQTFGRPGLLKTRVKEAFLKHLRRPEKLE